MSRIIEPDYYRGDDKKTDVIDAVKYFDLNFNTGNVLKYIVRAGKKDPSKHLDDLKKAMTYLQREISYVENKYKDV